jgi:hypothetical protein
MMPAAGLSKLAELRSRTDLDLLCLMQREVARLGSSGAADRDRRLRAARSMIQLIESGGPELRRLETDIDALLGGRRALRPAC